MILLVNRTLLSQEQAAWIGQEAGMEMHMEASFEGAAGWMRGAPCTIAVIDASLVETEGRAVDQLIREYPTLVAVFPNLAVCGPERLVQEIKTALRRNAKERQRASDSARRELAIHLRNSLTAMLLNCDLALQTPGLPDEAAKKLLLLHDLATQMRDQLEIQVGQAASA